MSENVDVVVIGAGPAGLTASYELHRYGIPSTILEADTQVGGISRTVERDGWRFDIGGHRFFSKVQRVEDFWHEILPKEDFLLRPRKSRIFYQGKYYDYPIKAVNALQNLGPKEAAVCIASYLRARVSPPKDQTDYESWLVARFGWRLYRTFFKTYTEKVWGVPVSEMPADWAAQRIKSLNLGNAILNAVKPKTNQKEITSLIEEFEYPKYGPGMMWEVCRDKVVAQGSKVIMETKVTKIRHENGKAYEVVAARADGGTDVYPATEVISSMPISQLVEIMDPPVPPRVLKAAQDLRYRDFLTVALVVPSSAVSWTDNWIYIHDPSVRTMRIQNFASWSPYLVKDGRNVLGLEYTVFENDADWTASDETLIEQGKQELDRLGLVKYRDIEDGYVVRQPKAYPIYDDRYQANVDVIRGWLTDYAGNVHPVGRNGMFRYNNADHSMYTAMLTAENIAKGTEHDVWTVNVEEEYHEEKASSSGASKPAGSLGTGRDAPVLPRKVLDAARSRVGGTSR
ncbi:NAD(P)/FAD-dependent oxidoreductase [Frankia sp. CNm7]|uniref:NAD(P)/FAD-dependent oxidoreductase n=1 Tax=Frankia nepalensis TaxID=1836974 RepID=A0A937RIH8_9ACTN|nr:NAD(P)/FAD-dependent oxidoreductase [Frankia nepalensis]MBL7497454.1 NAD(P)/FAD-dependent oxidoreductase [Frankia nepalensis]MBL7514704.1 NAD(P)/FAD-dependent oxidoreductase [Frankia nepalensis]MBL7524359.1 NAD(P)/FAD-dependent oxidoreductase [Frankia nepalensis]MBL7629590.1 NAD(P)/FAD-dependent oxidoreductase [Frankia nepalensis]